MRATRVWAVSAGVVLVLMVVWWMAAGRARTDWNKPNVQVKNARMMVTSLRGTFDSGKLVADPDPRSGDTQDMRMALVIGIIEKVQRNVSMRETNEARKAAALAKIDEFIKVFDQIVPKYQKAVQGRKADAARDLAADMRMLETRLDELQAILQGKTA